MRNFLTSKIIRELLILSFILLLGFSFYHTGKSENLNYQIRQCRELGKVHYVDNIHNLYYSYIPISKSCMKDLHYDNHPIYLKMILAGRFIMTFGYVLYLLIVFSFLGLRKLMGK